ncbi:MAG TPA: hypothetical protein VII35_06200 [Steroidobacteraceae bacterium]
MKIPKGLQPLLDDGMIDTVVRSLKSGKEAGRFARDPAAADVDGVLTQIEDERREAEARQRRREAADAA